jgi:hypothetical protein
MTTTGLETLTRLEPQVCSTTTTTFNHCTTTLATFDDGRLNGQRMTTTRQMTDDG